MRARNLKPKIFKNELLAVADPIFTLIFEGLWCLADREGRLEDRPALIHFEINPGRAFDTTDRAITWLAMNGFIERYRVGEAGYIQVTKFAKHQNPHHKEPPSIIPKPGANPGLSVEPVELKAQGKPGAKRHAKAVLQKKTGLIPDSGFRTPDSGSLIPDSEEASASSARAPTADVAQAAPEAEMSRQLSELGVQVTSSHPTLIAWLRDGYTLEGATAAAAHARVKKPWPEPIPANYLDKILRDPRATRIGNGHSGGKSSDDLIDEACG